MMMYTLTYHEVLPAFLDFIFPFGQQIYAQDFCFSGFCHEEQLAETTVPYSIPKLRRSGRTLRMCYSLKSVEKSPHQVEWPWSVRATATYHSFDVETRCALWISVKGNDLLEDRIMCATENLKAQPNPFETKEKAFMESLSIHLINCKWSGEEWRWYLNFLEEELQGNTRRSLSANVARRHNQEEIEMRQILRIRSSTSTQANTATNPRANLPLSQENGRAQTNRTRPISKEPIHELEGLDQFSFSDLQHIQLLTDKANEVVFVLNSNIDVLKELKEHYHDLVTSEEYPNDFGPDHKRVVFRFEKQITTIIRNLHMQISRAKTLVRLLADRKALVSLNILLQVLTEVI